MKLQIRKLILTILIALAVLSLVITFGILNTKEGDSKANSYVTGSLNPFDLANKQVKADGLVILGKLTSIDPLKNTFSIFFEFYPVGKYALVEALVPVDSLAVYVGTKNYNFNSGQLMNYFEAPFTLTEGDSNRYPIDSYANTLMFNARDGNNSVPIYIGFGGNLIGWQVDFKLQEDLQNSFVTSEIYFSRSITTRFFSFFIIILMWSLSICVFAVSLSIYIRGRSVEPPTIAVCAGILFALPIVRNIQPGVPAIGCTSDVVGLFWNIGFVGVSCIMLLINYVLRYKRVKKVEKVQEVQPASTVPVVVV